MSHEELLQRNQQLESLVRHLQAALDERDRRIVGLMQQVEKLQVRVAELEEQLRRMGGRRGRRDRHREGAPQPAAGPRRGGQVGHTGQSRPLLPPDQVDRVEDVYPAGCCHCGGPVQPQPQGEPIRHQVVEIPKVTPTVAEYRLHPGHCPRCDKTTYAPLPQGVPAGGFGPRVMATAQVLTGKYRLSRSDACAAMKELFGVDISTATVSHQEGQLSEALQEPVEQAHQFAQRQQVAGVDETSWRQNNEPAWLWVMSTKEATVFEVERHRDQEAAKKLLGTHQGFVVSDRYGAYLFVDKARRQVCWAHLLRDFEELAQQGGTTGKLGQELVYQTQQLFHRWHQFKRGELPPPLFRAFMNLIRSQITDLLLQGLLQPDKRWGGTFRELMRMESCFWTFVEHPQVEPTNNEAERQIRPAVRWRRVSFGTQSERGSRFVARILTVVQTLRKQGRSVLDYLEQAWQCIINGVPLPSLLPPAVPQAP